MNRIENTLAPAGVRCPWIVASMLAATALMYTVPVDAAQTSADSNLHQWELRRLNDPTERERAHEREGNVYIYDGLTDQEVEQALNAHFDRIEYMMFIGTRKTVPADTANSTVQSNVETESSGCM
jgi:hypothetical protein